MSQATWTRIGLGYLAIVAAQIGVWAQFAPRSFFDDFPGLGRTWVSVDGPYNEHLVRDVGGLYLALLVLIVAAMITLARPLVITASIAVLVSGVPHLVYHAVNRDGLSSGDLAGSLLGLLAFAAIPVALIVVELRAPAPKGDAGPATG